MADRIGARRPRVRAVAPHRIDVEPEPTDGLVAPVLAASVPQHPA